MRWGSVLITPDRLLIKELVASTTAGVQFSLPLIDFTYRLWSYHCRWGSVLITPDRLLGAFWVAAYGWGSVLITPDRLPGVVQAWLGKLGFSSHYP